MYINVCVCVCNSYSLLISIQVGSSNISPLVKYFNLSSSNVILEDGTHWEGPESPRHCEPALPCFMALEMYVLSLEFISFFFTIKKTFPFHFSLILEQPTLHPTNYPSSLVYS